MNDSNNGHASSNGHSDNGTDSSDRELLTVEQAAQYLQLSTASIRKVTHV